MNAEMMDALQALAVDRGISVETLLEVLVDAMQSAYEKMPGARRDAWVVLEPETGEFKVMAQDTDEDYQPIGDEYDVTPPNFGRIAAQAFKQVMTQKIREAERELKYEEYAGREGDIVTGIIQQSDARYTLLDLGRVEALLPQSEQVQYERAEPGRRVKAYIVEVRRTAKGPQIVVSRTHPGLIRRLFELEVPEIADGIVEIRACAREPGQRTKIAVWSNDPNVDPVGACVGARGGRVRMVVNELNGEKIDIVPFSDDLEEFVMKALAPAKVTEVRIDYTTGTATVIVPDYQLSLAIGKEGQNARLAHRLVGLRVDIVSETQMAENDANAPAAADWAEGEWITNAETGEQMWQPADGGPPISAAEWSQGGVPAPSPEVDPDAQADVDAEGLDDPESPDEEAAELGASDSPEAALEAEAALESGDDEGSEGGENGEGPELEAASAASEPEAEEPSTMENGEGPELEAASAASEPEAEEPSTIENGGDA